MARAIALACESLAAGQLVDLSGLDCRVDELCRAILALPRAEGRRFEAGLLALTNDLTRLNAGLTDRHAALVAEGLTGAGPHQAAAAYRRTQG